MLFLQTCAACRDRLCCTKACHCCCVPEAPLSLGLGALAAFFLARLPPMAVWQFPTFPSLFLFAVLPGCRALHSLAVCTYLCRCALSKRCCQHSRREHIRPCACINKKSCVHTCIDMGRRACVLRMCSGKQSVVLVHCKRRAPVATPRTGPGFSSSHPLTVQHPAHNLRMPCSSTNLPETPSGPPTRRTAPATDAAYSAAACCSRCRRGPPAFLPAINRSMPSDSTGASASPTGSGLARRWP